MCDCLSHAPNWGPGHNSGMCPDWELNRQSFGSQASAHSTEPHQPGLKGNFLILVEKKIIVSNILSNTYLSQMQLELIVKYETLSTLHSCGNIFLNLNFTNVRTMHLKRKHFLSSNFFFHLETHLSN